MKLTGFFHGVMLDNNSIILKAADYRDIPMLKKLFVNKKERESRTKKEILLEVEIDAKYQRRTFKQLAAVWKLIEIIFQAENDRRGTDEEYYDLYLDLLDLYADKTPSRYGDHLRPVHISEANTMAAANFIDGLLYHIATMCKLKMDLQSDVRKIIYAWEIWRGQQDSDINDNRTVEDIREKVVYSEASGRFGAELHHIVTRGADVRYIEAAWNLLALTHDEHMELHQKGWNFFLTKYPHLKKRIERTFDKAGHLPIPEQYEE